MEELEAGRKEASCLDIAKVDQFKIACHGFHTWKNSLQGCKKAVSL